MSDAPSDLLRAALLASQASQGELAQRIGIKSPSSICLILAGRRRLTPKMARRIALALELDADRVAEIEREAALSYIKV